jgi:hypothetical protein
VCRSQLLLVLASAVSLRSDSRGTHDHILHSQIRESPKLEGQVPVFISPRNTVARLYPQTLGSLFVASYDSQRYGGGIRNRLHTGCDWTAQKTPFHCCCIHCCARICWDVHVIATQPFPGNGRCLQSHYLGCPRDRYSAISWQRPLFTEPLLSKDCYITAYLAVVA